MKMRKLAAVAALTAAALGVAAGTADATPGTAAPAATQKAVHYTESRQGNAAVITVTDGTFKVATVDKLGPQLEILAADGKTVATAVPLTYHVNNKVFPISAKITGQTVALDPVDQVHGQPSPDPLPTVMPIRSIIAKPVSESFTPRDQQALSAFGSRGAISSLASAVTGAVIGGGIGCLLGGVVATAGVTIPAGLVSAGQPPCSSAFPPPWSAASPVSAPSASIGLVARPRSSSAAR